MIPQPQEAAKGDSTQKEQPATDLAAARRGKRPVSEGDQQTLPHPNGIELDENLSDGRGEIVRSSKASPGNTSSRSNAINNYSSPKEGNLRTPVRLSKSQQNNVPKDIYEVPDDEETQIEEGMSDEALNIILDDSTAALNTNPIVELDATAAMTLRSRHGRRRSCTILPSTESGLLPHPGKEAFSKFMLDLKPSIITPERLWHCPIAGCDRHKDSLLYEFKPWKKKQALKQHLESHHYEKLAPATPGSASNVPSHGKSSPNEAGRENPVANSPKPSSSEHGSTSDNHLPRHTEPYIPDTVPAHDAEEVNINDNLSHDSGHEQRLADLQAQLEAFEVGNSDHPSKIDDTD